MTTAEKAEPTPAELRKWANEHGVPVATRGRIPSEVREQYERAVVR